MPTPTGPPVELKDGTTMIPTANGRMVWDKTSNSVTIFNDHTNEASTFSGTALFDRGVRIYFNDGREVRITPSGLTWPACPAWRKASFVGKMVQLCGSSHPQASFHRLPPTSLRLISATCHLKTRCQNSLASNYRSSLT